MPTDTSVWYSVHHGDSTTFSTKKEIKNISNERVKWRGKETSTSTTYQSTNNVSATNFAIGDSLTVNMPTQPSGSTLYADEIWISASNGSAASSDWTMEIEVNGTVEGQVTIGSSVNSVAFDYGNPGDTVTMTAVDKESTAEKTLDSTELKGFIKYDETNIHYTKDPSVSGDLSASYTGSLTEDETTGWISATGSLSPNTSYSVTHSISDSGNGEWKFAYDFEHEVPTALAELGIAINGTVYKVHLADPNDSALEYTVYRVYDENHGVLCADVVKGSHKDAIPVKFEHPKHGTLSLRDENS